jgi:hypothetical protein
MEGAAPAFAEASAWRAVSADSEMPPGIPERLDGHRRLKRHKMRSALLKRHRLV